MCPFGATTFWVRARLNIHVMRRQADMMMSMAPLAHLIVAPSVLPASVLRMPCQPASVEPWKRVFAKSTDGRGEMRLWPM